MILESKSQIILNYSRISGYLKKCTLRVFLALAFATDKKSSHKIKHKKIPKVHKKVHKSEKECKICQKRQLMI